jgi:hypothetical protein
MQPLLIRRAQAAHRGAADPPRPGGGVRELAAAGRGELQQGHAPVGRVRAAGDQAGPFQAVGHVGNRARRDVQDLADLAHRPVGIFQRPQQLEALERQSALAERGVGQVPEPVCRVQEGINNIVAGLRLHVGGYLLIGPCA